MTKPSDPEPIDVVSLRRQVAALWLVEAEYHVMGYDPNIPLYAEFAPADLEAIARLLMSLEEPGLARDHLTARDLMVEVGRRDDDDWKMSAADAEALKRLAQWYFDVDQGELEARIQVLARNRR